MKEPIINNILKAYDAKRQRAQKFKEKRIEEVYNRLPRVLEIDNEISRSGLAISKAILSSSNNGSAELLKQLKEKLSELKQEKAILLTENNIPLQYLEEEFECNKCKDTGFLASGLKCSCYNQQLINYAYSMSNLNEILLKENFQTFNIDIFSDEPQEDSGISQRENMLENLNICEGFVINFNNKNEENLLFYGPTGLGKTFLTNCIAKALLDRGNIVIYQTAFKIFEIIEDVHFHNQAEKERYQLLFDADLLIIDDLGTEFSNGFTNSELFNIINCRLLSNKKTIISTNLSPKGIIERYDDRIFSRIFSKFTVMKFFGKDLRWQL
jgi:DNA replication protein DnaC